ncbi:unnamed protein product [Pocillopora meandrina]|uniref:LysR substrate-binding domain-containing protein n=1 Tax=Pocillopora meandrina TaxID=46732 RepID=A0AAU9VJC4_9CNID|nr:unnamed protein product [Pocillopora meandrina]
MNNISDNCLASSFSRVLGVGGLLPVATAIDRIQLEKELVIRTAIIEPNSVLIQEYRSSVTPLPQVLRSLTDISFE